MKKILLSGLAILALGTISFAQTLKYSPNFYRINFDAAAGTAIATGFPGSTLPSATYDVTCVTNGVQIKGKSSPSGPKQAYGDFIQFGILNAANPATIATPSTVPASKKLGIKIKSTGSYNPTLTIQVKDAATPQRVIDHLTAITMTATSTVYTIDLTNQLSQLYQGSNNGPLDSTKISQIFLSFDHGVATTTANIPNMDFEVAYFWIGDSTTVTTATIPAEAAATISSTKLYPNPVSDVANVELDLKSVSNVKVTLTDVMGKEVMNIANGTMASLSQSFSVANLHKGIYTVNYFINGSAAKAELLMVK